MNTSFTTSLPITKAVATLPTTITAPQRSSRWGKLRSVTTVAIWPHPVLRWVMLWLPLLGMLLLAMVVGQKVAGLFPAWQTYFGYTAGVAMLFLALGILCNILLPVMAVRRFLQVKNAMLLPSIHRYLCAIVFGCQLLFFLCVVPIVLIRGGIDAMWMPSTVAALLYCGIGLAFYNLSVLRFGPNATLGLVFYATVAPTMARSEWVAWFISPWACTVVAALCMLCWWATYRLLCKNSTPSHVALRPQTVHESSPLVTTRPWWQRFIPRQWQNAKQLAASLTLQEPNDFWGIQRALSLSQLIAFGYGVTQWLKPEPINSISTRLFCVFLMLIALLSLINNMGQRLAMLYWYGTTTRRELLKQYERLLFKIIAYSMPSMALIIACTIPWPQNNTLTVVLMYLNVMLFCINISVQLGYLQLVWAHLRQTMTGLVLLAVLVLWLIPFVIYPSDSMPIYINLALLACHWPLRCWAQQRLQRLDLMGLYIQARRIEEQTHAFTQSR
jgi:hypothetical protein